MEELRNSDKSVDLDDIVDLSFQCLHWDGDNQFIEEESDTKSKRKNFNLEHVVKVYGVTQKGISVSATITGFKPYFFIRLPDDADNLLKTKIMRCLSETKEIKPFVVKGLLDASIIERKEFYGFTNQKLFKFLKINFANISAMKQFTKLIRNGILIDKELTIFPLYESNILPFIRFMHERNLDAAGWIKIYEGDYVINTPKTSNCQIDITVAWEDVNVEKRKELAPFLIASFDIECDSSHGDFPLAIKNYKKLGCEIYDGCLDNLDIKSTNKERQVLANEMLTCAFADGTPPGHRFDISKIFTKGDRKPKSEDIDRLTKYISFIMSRKENYKILALDILRNLDGGIKDFRKEREIKFKTEFMIEDAFSDKIEKNTYGKSITKIYTKTNKKPNKREINASATKVAKVIKLLFSKIKQVLEIDDDDIKTIIDMFVRYESKPRSLINSKIQQEYDIDESDSQMLVTYIEQSMNQLYSTFEDIFPVIDNSRDTYCKRLTSLLNNNLPDIKGDIVTQIGTTVQRFGESDCFFKHIITLGGCDPIDGAHVESYDTEEEVLLNWTRFIQELDPDIITGYNIFGFDFSFMWTRAEELGIIDEFSLLGRERHLVKDPETNKRSKEWETKPCKLEIKKLSSSALGDNVLKYIGMSGRILMDLLKVVQKDFNLVSYKLDSVAETFINDKIKKIEGNKLTVSGIQTLAKGNYITINYGKDNKYKNKKFKIVELDSKTSQIYLEEDINEDLIDKKPKWTLAKDDVGPKDIFRLQKGSNADRKTVAVYCIQDCALCINLIEKLKLITNNIGMANVCYVPISFLFLRGQGVKIFSLVAKECRDAGYLVPEIKHDVEETELTREMMLNEKFDYGEDDLMPPPENDGGYEGAIVLDPEPGIYIDSPISVLDYSSLYPSSMISDNLSHDSIIKEEDNEYLGDEGKELLTKLGYDVVDREHDVYEWINPKIRSKGKRKIGKKTCRFVQPLDGSKCIIPNILKKLLAARKKTRKKIQYQTIDTGELKVSGLVNDDKSDPTNIIVIDEDGNKHTIVKTDIKKQSTTFSDFEQAVFDGLQLAYKLTANSLYGQIGARTSPIYLKDIAASTTATGRMLLYLAKEKVEQRFDGAKIIYGDTDSIFINFNPPSKGREGLKQSIEMGVQAEKYIQQFLKIPHKLEYEKTFWPFILFSKKRYIGNKYEFKTGPNDYKQTSMGIVLKRRDNAEIVKHVYGGVIDKLVNEQNVEASIDFLKTELKKLLNGKFGLDMLVITKSLRGYYKNPETIAHKVLADRIGVRDPGNKPSSNDRIPYVYIETKEKVALQGDRIETPEFILDNNLKPDYLFYITNQIMKPVAQIYSLIVEDLKGFKFGNDYYKTKYKSLLESKTPEKALAKLNDVKFKDTCDIIFKDVIRIAENKKNKATLITDFFGKK